MHMLVRECICLLFLNYRILFAVIDNIFINGNFSNKIEIWWNVYADAGKICFMNIDGGEGGGAAIYNEKSNDVS